jgi:hypothetical protein
VFISEPLEAHYLSRFKVKNFPICHYQMLLLEDRSISRMNELNDGLFHCSEFHIHNLWSIRNILSTFIKLASIQQKDRFYQELIDSTWSDPQTNTRL